MITQIIRLLNKFCYIFWVYPADSRAAGRGKRFLGIFGLWSLVFGLWSCFTYAFAEKITILYTGETHAMLYPCDCPMGLNGGIAKRATKIKEVRRVNPDLLLVDSGGVFAGGLLDEHSQTVELDKRRTLVNLEAMEIMGYDAVCMGDEEFNFGEDFLKKSIGERSIPFLSSNIEADYARPFIIKHVGNVRVGILALSPGEVKDKITNIKYVDARRALGKNVRILREQGVDVIVVLSHLGEEVDFNLINDINAQADLAKEIDVLVSGHRLGRSSPDTTIRVGKTVILLPAWQGTKLGKVDLDVENGEVIGYAIDDIPIDKKKIKDDPQILSILPGCFSDKDCHGKDLVGACNDAGTLVSKCVFRKTEPVSLLIIKPKVCRTCDTEKVIGRLEETLGALKVSYLNYQTPKGRELVERLGIDMLPAYLLGKEVEKNGNFNNFSKFLIFREDKYLVDPSLSGVSFFTGREEKQGNIDLFISLFNKTSDNLLRLVKGLTEEKKTAQFKLHFLGIIKPQGVITPYGLPELEEDLRAVCVMDKYPGKWWDYLICRAKNIQSSWWDDCLESCGMNINLIKRCSKSAEGKRLILENVALSSELEISSSGTFLRDDQEVFSIIKVPERKELERVIE